MIRIHTDVVVQMQDAAADITGMDNPLSGDSEHPLPQVGPFTVIGMDNHDLIIYDHERRGSGFYVSPAAREGSYEDDEWFVHFYPIEPVKHTIVRWVRV